MNPSPFYTGMLASLDNYAGLTGSHSSWEFSRVSVLPCLETLFSTVLLNLCFLQPLPTHCSCCSWTLGTHACMNTPQILSVCWLLWNNSSTAQRSCLIRPECCTNMWVQICLSRAGLILCPFSNVIVLSHLSGLQLWSLGFLAKFRVPDRSFFLWNWPWNQLKKEKKREKATGYPCNIMATIGPRGTF